MVLKSNPYTGVKAGKEGQGGRQNPFPCTQCACTAPITPALLNSLLFSRLFPSSTSERGNHFYTLLKINKGISNVHMFFFCNKWKNWRWHVRERVIFFFHVETKFSKSSPRCDSFETQPT
ncbi:hypothetical protein, unlikely [Trypanosoma brucei gambiense DAL972]|uniref:Uncharacterized protein n=1 Tax=Trypanosoma brucei gambiense (strain MHOM/CI/86/DAL972) TaxID=679716 RepID=C9ZVK8_TRYB9|nr:hypothetical protein, unlikely [Trypanosoma brucei gambiense DAL972]CBH13446.1 hypothetical protein, unlikely [Trypanosoma brucei gambiense DAL972]|eukprot:XP_011775723.1 hypothetical protein, unlikely [Trypanosoma brucei gambiense DAL972]